MGSHLLGKSDRGKSYRSTESQYRQEDNKRQGKAFEQREIETRLTNISFKNMEHYHHDGCTCGCDHDHEECSESKIEQAFSKYNLNLDDEKIKAQVERILNECKEENNTIEVKKFLFNSVELTTLQTTDSEDSVYRFVEKVNQFDSKYPELGHVATVCVYPNFARICHDTLENEEVEIACVSGSFPSSQTFQEIKVAETAMAIHDGATEIDIVISIGKFLEGNYQEVFDEISEVKAAIQDAHLKVILETGALKTAENIYKASILAMAAGADFIKTSTGKVPVNATPEATYVMCQAIKAWKEKTGEKVCYKPAGGVSTTAEAVQHYTLVKEILGEEWLNNESFRFGASRLANNLLTSITGNEVKYF